MKFTIEQRPATPKGRLYPSYDSRVKILSAGSNVARSWPYGANIDSRLIFDADNERVLANFDLMLGKPQWKAGVRPSLPSIIPRADILLTEQTVLHKFYPLQVSVTSDSIKSWVYIYFGDVQTGTTWLELSEKVFAQVWESQLLGFFVML